MPQARFIPDAEFAPAPIGTRVRFATLLSAVAAFGTEVIATAVLLVHRAHPAIPSGRGGAADSTTAPDRAFPA